MEHLIAESIDVHVNEGVQVSLKIRRVSGDDLFDSVALESA